MLHTAAILHSTAVCIHVCASCMCKVLVTKNEWIYAYLHVHVV